MKGNLSQKVMVVVASLLLGTWPFMFIFGTSFYVYFVYDMLPVETRTSLYMWHPPRLYDVPFLWQVAFSLLMLIVGIYLILKLKKKSFSWARAVMILASPWWIFFFYVWFSFHMRFF